ncbi:hypothetical protein [uncultured Cohaesibacter sp.]|uniref:hypothetical protein n=1 Tax=uncultured Cohaesibacter sp. TaxID=1002546 RepID=UPI002AAA9B71|nr:hypothetical protein [uncultured Cohaesibacter sp.]
MKMESLPVFAGGLFHVRWQGRFENRASLWHSDKMIGSARDGSARNFMELMQ